MSDEGNSISPATTTQVEKKVDAAASASETTTTDTKMSDSTATAKAAVSDAPKKASKADTEAAEKPTDATKDQSDVDTKDEAEVPAPPAAADAESAPSAEAETGDAAGDSALDKFKGRRKSAGIPEHKGKKLSKKASKAKFFHTAAQPGDHFLVKLKGYPQWPVIICDEEMLPETLLKHRPVTAKRADGTYREDYAEGGKRVNDRTFPVMYLRTNEFGWVPNSALQELPSEKARELLTDKIRKAELKDAFELAIEQNSLEYYKNLLQKIQEELLEQQAIAAEATPAKKSKKKAAVVSDGDEDAEMADVADEEEPAPKEKAKSKKRKAEEEASTPQRSDSVKKPKIKLNTSSTPKAANGVATPKSAKEPSAKHKSKPKQAAKDGEDKKTEKEVPKEPELSAKDKLDRKEKEVLFLRHKLQKGLLTRDQEPKEDEMKMMSEYITKLENFPDLEVSIIRQTKINKVLKAILKLDSIPKESEFNFKSRSQALLDKWNKLLAGTEAGTAAPAPSANGVNGTSGEAAEPKKASTNGVKAEKESDKAAGKLAEAAVEEKSEKGAKSIAEEAAPASEAVEASA